MTKPLDLIGQRFGLLTVVARAPFNNNQGGAMWICRCDCGGEKIARAPNLRNGRTTSCNCVRVKQVIERNKRTKRTHGMADSAEYGIWGGMIDRATNPNSKDFANYQGRGITVCERWRTFENFFADMGKRPSAKHSIDRIDNDKGYSPDNCRWALTVEQSSNRRTNVFVTHNGETKTLAQWADDLGIIRGTIYRRYSKGLRGDHLFLVNTAERFVIKRQ